MSSLSAAIVAELHLHPKVQSRLADFFLSIVLSGKQCIAETHSEHIIDRLRLRIVQSLTPAKLRKNIAICFADNQEGFSKYKQIEVNDYGVIPEWPEGFFDQSPKDISATIRAEALKCALDIRKFEINLYWKRATYFWTLIAAAFAGYLALASTDVTRPGLVFLVTCIGFILSTAWYLVNRGSKFWQENWERHVDILENEIIGPLFKTTISKNNFRFLEFWSGYPYSVSKVNQIVSLFVTLVWLGLVIHAFPHCLVSLTIQIDAYWLLATATLLFTVALFWLGRTRSEKIPREINLLKHDLTDSEF